MNIWSRLLLHLRRARLRQRFTKQQETLRTEFRTHLLAGTTQDRRWHDVEWLTEPILHVLPDTEEVPVALVGIAAMYSLNEGDEETAIRHHASDGLESCLPADGNGIRYATSPAV